MFDSIRLEQNIQVFRIKNNLVGANTFVILIDDVCVVIDPGSDSNLLADFLLILKFNSLKILLTHGHFDHVIGCSELTKFNPEIFMSRLDQPHLEKNNFYLKAFGEKYVFNNFDYRDFDDFEADNILVHNTPGHTSGSKVIQIGNGFFAGDSILSRSVFAPTVRGSDRDLQAKSVLELLKILKLDDYIFPGHGTPGTLRTYIANNLELCELLNKRMD